MPNNITVKDASGVNQIIKTTDNSSVHTKHVNVDTLPSILQAAQSVVRLAINISTSGDNTIVSGVGGQKVKLIGGVLVANGDVDLTIKSGASTSLTGAMPLATKGNILQLNPIHISGLHWLETVAADALVFNLSAAVAVRGFILYRQEA